MMMITSLRTAIEAENEHILDKNVRRHVYALQQERRTTKREAALRACYVAVLCRTLVF